MVDKPLPDVESRPRYDEETRLIAQIVTTADRTLRPRPALLITVGLVGAAIDLCYYFYYRQLSDLAPARSPNGLLTAGHYLGILMIVGVIAALAIKPSSPSRTVVDRQLTISFGVAASLALLVDNLGWPRWVMAGPEYAMIWNLVLAIPMLSIGLQYSNRILVGGGVALAASLVASRFDPWQLDLYLALGMLLGCALPGIIFGVRGRA